MLRLTQELLDLNDDIERILITEEEIRAGIDRVARRITERFRGVEFTAVSVLKGSCIFVSDLVRRIPIPLHMAFVSAQSYRAGTEPGPLEIELMPAREEVAGRRFLLVDDILDTGQTLSRISSELLSRGALEVATCVFLDKPARRRVELEPDFRVFEIEDLFVVGYGLDYAGRYRNLPCLASLKPEILAATAGDPRMPHS